MDNIMELRRKALWYRLGGVLAIIIGAAMFMSLAYLASYGILGE